MCIITKTLFDIIYILYNLFFILLVHLSYEGMYAPEGQGMTHPLALEPETLCGI